MRQPREARIVFMIETSIPMPAESQARKFMDDIISLSSVELAAFVATQDAKFTQTVPIPAPINPTIRGRRLRIISTTALRFDGQKNEAAIFIRLRTNKTAAVTQEKYMNVMETATINPLAHINANTSIIWSDSSVLLKVKHGGAGARGSGINHLFRRKRWRRGRDLNSRYGF